MRRCLLLLVWLAVSGCDGGFLFISFGDQSDDDDCPGSLQVKLTAFAPNFTFNAPLLMLPHPSLAEVFYVVEQGGRIHRLDLITDSRSELVDLTDHYSLSGCNECGLLGMTFDPNFAANGLLYLSFTEQTESGMVSFVSRFESADNGRRLRESGAGELLRMDLVEQPQPFANHNGGHITFGPDGLLYVGLGDGGSANDPGNRAQSLSTRLGKMLRINADGSPANNGIPGALPEIYAYGLRNPWRWSFDRATGVLWAGDVGQNRFEEVDRISRGGNYGWRCFEGFHRTSNGCDDPGPFIDPVAEYDHGEGSAVTGGYVYRGSEIPGLQGAYLFSDFGSGTLWALEPQSDGSYRRRTLLESGRNVASFAEDNAGELYLITFTGLFRIDPADSSDGCIRFSSAARLSQGG
ncbi:MAG: PQQ-dependent sugar dehydrogenase [Marinobacter sp.]|uniref:PQQ-dependent sugar dehydrogenase n=1 Tax=Marinobacter sp. TaxID=50741 RepID=UPI00299D007F|nr:PQQ-dependent sugar dehydrogenase [Marinobacter sp.]MDX1755710.1 PQQ-dependent sugar dehydrogenase [Marinobacter sp.]